GAEHFADVADRRKIAAAVADLGLAHAQAATARLDAHGHRLAVVAAHLAGARPGLVEHRPAAHAERQAAGNVARRRRRGDQQRRNEGEDGKQGAVAHGGSPSWWSEAWRADRPRAADPVWRSNRARAQLLRRPARLDRRSCPPRPESVVQARET